MSKRKKRLRKTGKMALRSGRNKTEGQITLHGWEKAGIKGKN
jgi:hypothetical protein